MSLSGQYLEELSRRYKKQVEDMQRVLLEAADDRQKSTEREGKLSQEIIILNRKISQLTISVNSLINERESWGYRVSIYVFLIKIFKYYKIETKLIKEFFSFH